MSTERRPPPARSRAASRGASAVIVPASRLVNRRMPRSAGVAWQSRQLSQLSEAR